ncbi:protein 5NUC-like [Drosophila novamexicana]|uniref:protein 5NUC-like n=1 Tax=Drosophila novamexicana TaxID=47314 RepID=UPI0011E5E5BB|nr:protein 5NUC-like [Drosophila novamexicana]
MDWLIVLWNLILLPLLTTGVHSFRFTILHNNDMHARYDPISSSCGKCPKGDDEKGLCFGGFARVATVVTQARTEGSTLYLNAGDTFHGTNWYRLYKGDLAADLLNILNPDAVSLGNHEFDDNFEEFLPFLKKVRFPIVCCNLDLRMTPELHNLGNLVRSTIITKLDKNIGIIGYLTPSTKYYVPYNSIEYFQEIPSINLEAKRLRNKGINIIIALGHSGYEVDKKVALHCPDVDVVIGGHSHTFLYTGTPPEKEKPEGKYPTVVTRRNGQQVPVLQAYAFTKYMGKIDLVFDDNGNLVNFSGSPILLDYSIPQQADIMSLLAAKRQRVDYLDGKDAKKKTSFLKMMFSESALQKSTGYAASIVNILALLLSLFVLLRNNR